VYYILAFKLSYFYIVYSKIVVNTHTLCCTPTAPATTRRSASTPPVPVPSCFPIKTHTKPNYWITVVVIRVRACVRTCVRCFEQIYIKINAVLPHRLSFLVPAVRTLPTTDRYRRCHRWSQLLKHTQQIPIQISFQAKCSRNFMHSQITEVKTAIKLKLRLTRTRAVRDFLRSHLFSIWHSKSRPQLTADRSSHTIGPSTIKLS